MHLIDMFEEMDQKAKEANDPKTKLLDFEKKSLSFFISENFSDFQSRIDKFSGRYEI